MSLVAAIENGPAARSSRRVHVEKQIDLAEARARKARDRAAIHRRKANGQGGWHAAHAAIQHSIADDQTKRANRLRTKLAKDEAVQAAKDAARVKRTAGSTAAAGLVPKTPGQTGQPQVATPGHLAHPQPTQPKGQSMPGTVSGEAVDIEQTRALLDQLRSQVSDLRGSFEGASGSLASGGLNGLAGELAQADDALDSVLSSIDGAEKHLSDQEAIAEAAQAAGEMHRDPAFYGA